MTGERDVVAFLCGKDPTKEISGGHSSYVRAHARAAAAAGFEPLLFCLGRGRATVETPFGILHRFPSRAASARQWGIPWHAPALGRALLRAFATRGIPPRVHAFGLWGWAGVLAAREARRRGAVVRTIVSAYTSHGEEARSLVRGLGRDCASPDAAFSYRAQEAWSRLVLRRWERRMLRESDRVAVNYESVRRLLERVHGPLPHIVRLPYCSELAAIDPEARRDPRDDGSALPPTVVSIARHDPRKGVGILIEALSRLERAGVGFRARLVGAGPLLDAHRRRVSRLGLAGRIEITGPVPDASAELRRSDVFVLPSLEEQSGSLALLEALQSGIPAVATGVDGILEDVEDGRTAILVPPGDAAALAAAIGRLLADPLLRRRIANQGRELYRRRFAVEGLARALRDLYGELFADGAGPPPAEALPLPESVPPTVSPRVDMIGIR